MSGAERLAAIAAALWGACFTAALIGGGPALAGAQSLLLLLFVLVHGGVCYGARGIAAFFVIALLVALALEALSIHTGFPFGFYEHAPAMGPRLLKVPYAVAAGYPVLGYFGWTLARLLVRATPEQATRAATIATPLAAAFILTGYDLAYDPIGAAALGLWTFRTPSGQFGSPLSNYLGWLFTGWVFFQLFALVERRLPRLPRARAFWLLPCLVWGAMALQFAAMYARAPAGTVARGGRVFVTADIYEAGLITALLTMLFAAVAAGARLWTRDADG